MTDIDIHPTRANDSPGLQIIAEQTGLFPPEVLPDLLRGFLSETPEDLWLTAHSGSQPVGLCYAQPEPLTDGTWNMRALAVRPDHQRHGVGALLISRLEKMLADHGHRLLVVDTSGTGEFETARRFYAANGYAEAARLPDFWAEGDDKVVFLKTLR